MFSFIKSLFGRKEKNGKGRKPRGNRRVRRVANPERLPLDLKPETPKIRRQKQTERRRKHLRTGAMLLTGVSLVALGNTAVQETLFKNPRFSLRQVYVDTTGMLSPTRIINATGLTEGVNLLTVNLRDVRERVQHLPGVRGATVQRDFDGKLTITVDQRQPIAWVKCDYMHWVPRSPAHGMLVDEEAVAIPAETISEEMLALPEISVDAIRQGDAGCEIKEPKFVTALNLTKALLKRQEQGGAKLKSVETSKKFALVASFHGSATTTFSVDDYESQLLRYDAVTARGHEKNFEIDRINIIGEHVAPVSFKVAPESAPEPEKSKAEPPAAHSSTSSKAKTTTKGRTGSKSSH
jgi:hypothetical protein